MLTDCDSLLVIVTFSSNFWSITGILKLRPGCCSSLNFPKRSITALSCSSTIYIDWNPAKTKRPNNAYSIILPVGIVNPELLPPEPLFDEDFLPPKIAENFFINSSKSGASP